jgi:hypothetical protein
MRIEIKNYNDLIDFIKREDVTIKQAKEVISKTLTLIIIFEMSKTELIQETERYINTYCKNGHFETPIFLSLGDENRN